MGWQKCSGIRRSYLELAGNVRFWHAADKLTGLREGGRYYFQRVKRCYLLRLTSFISW